jgi:hypothetical protein
MQKDYPKNEVLNTVLTLLIAGLDIVIALIALGFLIGLYELIQ